MLIGELAKRTSVTVDTVRFYERKGLVKPSSVRESGYREYDDRRVADVLFIRRAKQLGFALKEIRELLVLRSQEKTDCRNVRRLAGMKLKDVDEKLAELRSIRRVLKSVIEDCEIRGRSDACPILEVIEDGDDGS